MNIRNYHILQKAKATLALVALCMALQTSYSQSTKETKDAIATVLFMEGVWKGTGWVMLRDKKQQFYETETVTKKLNGQAIQIEAFGIAVDDSTNIINNALGILSYNESSNKFMLRVVNFNGSYAEADARITQPFTFEWSMRYQGVYWKYIIEVKNKKWLEKGYSSTDGTNWNPFFEMELSKQ
jgi:hypothetical protein